MWVMAGGSSLRAETKWQWQVATVDKGIIRKNRGNYGAPGLPMIFGSRFCCGKNRVARIMKANGIVAKTKKKFKATTNSKHNLPVAENLLKQDFTSPKPNAIWVSDVTYIWTNEAGYICQWSLIYFLVSRGWPWAIAWRRTCDQVTVSAIGRRRPPPGVSSIPTGSSICLYRFSRSPETLWFRQSMSKKVTLWQCGRWKLFSYAKDRACVSAQLFDTSRSTAQYFRIYRNSL